MPNSKNRYSNFSVPTRPQERKNSFETSGIDYPKGKFEVFVFDLNNEGDREEYISLMNTIYSDKSKYFDIRRETYNYEFSQFVRIEYFYTGGEKEASTVKEGPTYHSMIQGALEELVDQETEEDELD